MVALKMTMASTICGKPHMDRWVRRITMSTSNSSSVISRREGEIRAKTMAKARGSTTALSSKIGEKNRMWVGSRLLSCAHFGQKGLGRNWGQRALISEAKNMGSGRNEGHKDRSPSLHNNNHQCPRLLTLPTILTLGRVAAVPLIVITFYMNSWWAPTATTSIFIAAAITDWLDGYIARKMQLDTAFGAFLDPVADKLMVAATLVLLCTRPLELGSLGEVPWLLPIPAIAIIGREITMSAVREWAASQNSKVLKAVAVNNLGKWKTATQMVALTILLATCDSSLMGAEVLVPLGVGLLYISAGLAVWSLAVYIRKIWRILLK